jgi:hypothetical protein
MAHEPTRRKLASAAALLAALGSTGPFVGTAEAEPGSQLATIEDYATQEYEAWSPDAGGDLLLLSKFLPRAADDHALIVMALAVMKRDHLQNAAIAAEAPHGDLCNFAEMLSDAAERYRGLAETLDAAHIRVLAGMARHLTAIGEA